MRRTGVWWVAAGAALWGTDTVLRRPLSLSFSSIHLVFYEHLFLAVAVLPFLLQHRSALPKIRVRVWLAVLAVAWIGSVAATTLFTISVRTGNPTASVLLQKIQPVAAIVMARFLLVERLPRRFGWAAAGAMAGAYLVAFGDAPLRPWTVVSVLPALAAILAAGGWASATVFGRLATAAMPFQLLLALRVLLALPLLAAVVSFEGWITPDPQQASTLVVLAIVPGFLALLLYYRGLRTTTASAATIAELAFPLTASLLNWVVLGIVPGLLQIAGFALVWAAIYLISNEPAVC